MSVLPQIVLNCNRGSFATAHKRGSSKSKQAHKSDEEEPQFIFHAVGCTKLEAIIGALEHFQLPVPPAALRFHHIFPRRLRADAGVTVLGDARVADVLEEMQRTRSCFGLLDVTNEGLSDAVCSSLRALLSQEWCHLRTLYLGGNEFGPQGLTLLSAGVCECRSLETLELNRCDIAMSGLQALSLHMQTHRLHKLDLSDNPFSLHPTEDWLGCLDRLLPTHTSDIPPSLALGMLDLLIEEVSEPSTAALQKSFTMEPCSRVDRSPRTRLFTRRENPCVILA